MALDKIDRQIIEILRKDARLPIKTLAERIGLSSPGATDRLRRLEDRGVIRAFTLDVDPYSLGYSLQAIVRIKPLPGKLQTVEKLLKGIPELSDCDKVTGDDCFVARLHLRSIEHLDFILERISDKAETNSSIVKSQLVPRRLPSF